MSLGYKFVLPVNLVLVFVIVSSLGWEWRRQEGAGLSLLRARLDEEARFILAAYQTFGAAPPFEDFLKAFCHASDVAASPEHQVALLDRDGGVLASAAEHARRPMDLAEFAAVDDGFQSRRVGGESLLVRVLDGGGERVVVAESTRAVSARVWSNLTRMAAWPLGASVLLFGAINFVMRRSVLRPIRRIGRAARELERGRLGVEIASPTNDELGALARRFNAMSRALADQAEANRREMETARNVQAGLLPPALVRFDGLEIAGRCIQAGPVGGDIYDVRLLNNGRVGLLVADLSGHNVAAALHTAMVRAIVWREAEQADSPGDVLSRLNDQLCRNLPDEHFATVFFAWFDPEDQRLHYANAGHPPALARLPNGEIRELGPTMPLLGVVPDLAGDRDALRVEPGFRLLVFSDGLSETEDPSGNFWGVRDLPAFLETVDEPKRAINRLLQRAEAFRAGAPQQDDLTIVLALVSERSLSRPDASLPS